MPDTPIGRLLAILKLDDKQFRGSMREIESSLSRFGASARQVGGTLTKSLTLPLAGVGTAVAGLALNFQKEMNRVAAITGATGSQFKQLEGLAKELGRTTAFSASQAAEGMGFLAQAGFKTDQILAALPGTLNVAAAAQIDLARAADIASNVLSAFRLEASEVGRVGDVLTATFTQSNTDMEQLAEAMKFVSATSASLGISLEETSAAIGLLGNAGLQGSIAGTSLNQALIQIVKPSKEAAQLAKDLGINFRDASGNILPLADILGQLEAAGVGAEEALTLFGVRGGRAINTLLGQSDELRDFAGNLGNSVGKAAEIAEEQLKGLPGAFTRLKSAAEGAGLALADAGITQFLESAASAITGIAQRIAEADPQIQKLIVTGGGIALVLGPAITALGLLATAIGAIGIPVAAAIAAAGALVAGFVAFRDDLAPLGSKLLEVGKAVFEMAKSFAPVQIAIKAAQGLWAEFGDDLVAVARAFVTGVAAKLSSFADLVLDLVEPWKDANAAIVKAAEEIYQGVKKWLVDAFGDVVAAVREKVEAITGFFGDLFDKVVGNSFVPDMIDEIARQFGRLDTEMIQPAQDATGAVADAFGDLFEGIQREGELRFEELAKTVLGIFRDLSRDIDGVLTIEPRVGGFAGGQVTLGGAAVPVGGGGSLAEILGRQLGVLVSGPTGASARTPGINPALGGGGLDPASAALALLVGGLGPPGFAALKDLFSGDNPFEGVSAGEGALRGAALGTIILPGIGTTIGAIAGALGAFKPEAPEVQLRTVPLGLSPEELATAPEGFPFRGGQLRFGVGAESPFGLVGQDPRFGGPSVGGPFAEELANAVAGIDTEIARFLNEDVIAVVSDALTLTETSRSNAKQFANNKFGTLLIDRFETIFEAVLGLPISGPQQQLTEGIFQDIIDRAVEAAGGRHTEAFAGALTQEFAEFLAERQQFEQVLASLRGNAIGPATEAGKALAALGDDIDFLRDNAERLGFSLDELNLGKLQKQVETQFRAGFVEGIERQILAITDPFQLALVELADFRDQLFAEVEEVGAGFDQATALVGLKLDALLDQAGAPIQGFLDALQSGTASPLPSTTVFENAQAVFDSFVQDALAGTANLSEFPTIAGNLLSAAEDLFGSTSRFFEIFDAVVLVGEQILANLPALAEEAGFDTDTDASALETSALLQEASFEIGELTQAVREGDEEEQGLLASVIERLEAVDAKLAALVAESELGEAGEL